LLNCQNSDLIGQTVSDQAKNGLHKSAVGGSSPETLSQGIKRTAGSHPRESVSGELPRAVVHIGKIKCSLVETADKAWIGHDRSDSANPTAPVKLSLSYYS
jgi:hypothetical protein